MGAIPCGSSPLNLALAGSVPLGLALVGRFDVDGGDEVLWVFPRTGRW